MYYKINVYYIMYHIIHIFQKTLQTIPQATPRMDQQVNILFPIMVKFKTSRSKVKRAESK